MTLFFVWATNEFVAREPDEISFKAGERILVLEKDDEYADGWWKGENAHGQVGIFPSNFVVTYEPKFELPASISSCASDTEDRAVEVIGSPETWTVKQVCDWLCQIGYHDFSEKFKEHSMNGLALLSPFLDISALKELGMDSLKTRLRFMEELDLLKQEIGRIRSMSLPIVSDMPSPVSECDFGKRRGTDLSEILKPAYSKIFNLVAYSTDSIPKPKRTTHLTAEVHSDIASLSTVLSGAKPDIQGYLLKRGGAAKWSWKKRFFVLKEMTLFYFKDQEPSSKPLGIIPLPSYRIAPDKDCDIAREVFIFKAEHPDVRTYYFKAETLEEMTLWMNLMVKASFGMISPENQHSHSQLFAEADEVSVVVNIPSPAVPRRSGMRNQNAFCYAHITSELSQIENRVSIDLDYDPFEKEKQFICWINGVLFFEFDLPEHDLDKVSNLTDLADGIHLFEFLLRLKFTNAEDFEKHRQLIIVRPQNSLQKLNNMKTCWNFVRDELADKKGRPSRLMQRMQLSEVKCEDVCSGKKESILKLLAMTSKEFPSSFDKYCA